MRFCIFLLILVSPPKAEAALDFRLYASLDSPQILSTVVSITGLSAGSGSPVWYRFRSRKAGGSYRIIRDFGPRDTLDWTVYEQEGLYEMEVTAQDKGNAETSTISLPFEWLPAAKDNAVVTPTQHPLVFLHSSPPCTAGAVSWVQFSNAKGRIQQTPRKDCDGVHTMNFLVAGLAQESDYDIQSFVADKVSTVSTPALRTHTQRLNDDLQIPIAITDNAVAADSNGVILFAAQQPNYEMATDLDGNVVWYYPDGVSTLTNPAAGGLFLGLIGSPAGPSTQRMIMFDLMGLTVKETNVARINEQLALLGKQSIGALHHEARLLPDGKILLLASRMQALTDVQGSGAVNIIGDMIIVLNEDLSVIWVWDAFDWLDPHRAAVLGETCGMGSCPPVFRAPAAHDWTHGNSLQLGADGSLLFSIRHQDWVVKINYENGKGDGRILWRLGKEGDFTMDSTDPEPWFSHQHDARFVEGDPQRIILFDNGNTRYATDPGTHSRGQVIEIDEVNRTARLLLNADLGVYSFSLGSAQKLDNGDFYFGAGALPDGSSVHMEVDATGKIVRSLSLAETVYRSFRMADLYGGIN